MADIAKMLMAAIKDYESTRRSNMRMNQQQNQFNQRNFMANKIMKQRAAQFASRQELQRELAGMREEGRNRRFEAGQAAKSVLSPKKVMAIKAKEQYFIKNMGKPQIYEGPENRGTRTYDNPFASVTGGPATVKQPLYVRPKKNDDGDLISQLEKRAQVEAIQGRLKARGY